MKIVLESCKEIYSTSRYVSVNVEKIKHWIGSNTMFKAHLHKKLSFSEDMYFPDLITNINYLILFNSINFAFWNYKGQPIWTYNENGIVYNRTAGIKKALYSFFRNNNFNLAHYTDISFNDFKKMLQGGDNLILLEERWNSFKEALKTLYIDLYGDGSNLITLNDNTEFILNRVVELFPSWNDKAELDGKCIYFYKRAQLLMNHLSELVEIKNLSCLTAFADYRLPQILRYFNIIEYESNLAKTIDESNLIKKNSREEIEIRANTIIACELIKNLLAKNLNIVITSSKLDSILWEICKDIEDKLPEHHKCMTTNY